MVNKNKITNLIVLGALMCVAPAAFADCPQTPAPASSACMNLINPGYTGGFAGVYVGPYTASINGGTPTAVICDDYLDESYIPEYWTADIYQGSESLAKTRNATNPDPANVGPSLSPQALQQAYDEVGYLALKLLATPVSDAATVGEIHFALWSVFDPNALSDLNQAFGGTKLTDPSPILTDAYKGAEFQLNEAIGAVGGADDPNFNKYISQFTIYSPDSSYQICPGSIAACSTKNAPPQEFLVKTPEAPFFALLGVDLSGLGAVIFLLHRRRTSRP